MRPANSSPQPDTRRRPAQTPSTAAASQSEYHRALELSKRADKRPARNAFRSAAAAFPTDPRLWLAWAQMEARIGRLQSARRIFAEGIRANPSNVRLRHACAVTEDRAGNVKQARAHFEHCLELDPCDGLVWQSYALLEERAGRTDVAAQIFTKGVQADPDNAYLWSAWGVLEHRHGRYARAAELFQHATELNPRHARTYQAWAITAEKLSEFNQARELFRTALQIDTRSVPTYQAFALFESRRGNLDKARELFQIGIDYDPNHAAIWHAWAVMEHRAGNYDDARKLFNAGVNAAPDSAPMLRAWATMELELGHIDRSQDWEVPRSAQLRRGGRKGAPNQKNNPGRRSASDKQISRVGENLQILRLMIERRSDDDIANVMKWLDRRARSDRNLYDSIAERGETDSRRVREWVARRSTSDVQSFKEWLDKRYDMDRRIGVYIFNWDIPVNKPAPVAVPVAVPASPAEVENVDVPIEWFRLSEEPEAILQLADENLYCQDAPPDYANGVQFMGQIAENLVDRAALLFVLGAMSLGLVWTSAFLFDLGYSPSGESTQTGGRVEEMAPPSGVDAHLYEDGGAESAVSRHAKTVQGK